MMVKQALIVDDNDGYVDMIKSHLVPLGYDFERATLAKEGIKLIDQRGEDHYQLIVTDITMEDQLAGFRFLRHVRKKGYSGPIIVASTGFDGPLGLFFAKGFLRWFRVDLLVPKLPLKSGIWQCLAISRQGIERADLINPSKYAE